MVLSRFTAATALASLALAFAPIELQAQQPQPYSAEEIARINKEYQDALNELQQLKQDYQAASTVKSDDALPPVSVPAFIADIKPPLALPPQPQPKKPTSETEVSASAGAQPKSMQYPVNGFELQEMPDPASETKIVIQATAPQPTAVASPPAQVKGWHDVMPVEIRPYQELPTHSLPLSKQREMAAPAKREMPINLGHAPGAAPAHIQTAIEDKTAAAAAAAEDALEAIQSEQALEELVQTEQPVTAPSVTAEESLQASMTFEQMELPLQPDPKTDAAVAATIIAVPQETPATVVTHATVSPIPQSQTLPQLEVEQPTGLEPQSAPEVTDREEEELSAEMTSVPDFMKAEADVEAQKQAEIVAIAKEQAARFAASKALEKAHASPKTLVMNLPAVPATAPHKQQPESPEPAPVQTNAATLPASMQFKRQWQDIAEHQLPQPQVKPAMPLVAAAAPVQAVPEMTPPSATENDAAPATPAEVVEKSLPAKETTAEIKKVEVTPASMQDEEVREMAKDADAPSVPASQEVREDKPVEVALLPASILKTHDKPEDLDVAPSAGQLSAETKEMLSIIPSDAFREQEPVVRVREPITIERMQSSSYFPVAEEPQAAEGEVPEDAIEPAQESLPGSDLAGWDDPTLRSDRALSLSIRQNDTSLYDNLKSGRDALSSGQAESAIVFYKRALEGAPDNQQALFGLATSYQVSGQREKARGIYIDLIKKDQQNWPAINNFLILATEESPDDALRHLEDLQKSNPNFAPISAQIGMIYLKKQDYKQAVHHLARASSLDQKNMRYRYDLAQLLEYLGDNKTAALVYRQMLTASLKGAELPESPSVIQSKIEAIAAKGG